MCRLYGVTRAGYYAWKKRPPSRRALEDQEILQDIRRIHAASRGIYGSPRVTQVLRQNGTKVGEKRVARLMQQEKIKGRSATLYRANPANHAFFTSIPNRGLKVLAQQPNSVWVGDITYIKVKTEWRYLAVVMDKCTRKVVGWSLGSNRDANLTIKALNRAVANRRPGAGVIFHTDRGIEYAAHAFRNKLGALGFVQSMNRPQRMNDNGHMESFFHSMKSEAIHGKRFETDKELLEVVRSYIPFYNTTRLHSSLNYVAPATFEKQLASPGCQ
jgi:putative transposase